MKIIYIAGDGRSGSTLLDSVLSNIDNSISVGECHRFWNRFYEKETFCGCSEKIEECSLWAKVDKRLKEEFPNYDPIIFQEQVKRIQFYKNFKNIPQIIENEEWKSFCEIVKYFYKSVSLISEKKVIIDSSKSIGWAYLLQNLNFCDLRIIHLERNLSSVANSWKKTIILPEYYDKKVFMPKKSNFLILKSWLKIKFLARKLKMLSPYFYMRYEELCRNPNYSLNRLQKFVEENLDLGNLQMQLNHAIGGNPMRSKNHGSIEIKSKKESVEKLNNIENLGFSVINILAKKLL